MSKPRRPLGELEQSSDFVHRHIGPNEAEIDAMLAQVGVPSLDALIDRAVPKSIRSKAPLDLPSSRAERDVLAEPIGRAPCRERWFPDVENSVVAGSIKKK